MKNKNKDERILAVLTAHVIMTTRLKLRRLRLAIVYVLYLYKSKRIYEIETLLLYDMGQWSLLFLHEWTLKSCKTELLFFSIVVNHLH